MTKTILTLVLALAAAPLALADSGNYAAPGGLTGFCDPVGAGSDVGIVCELACVGTCLVVASDVALPGGAIFNICDWDAAAGADVNCSDLGEVYQGSTVWTSTTGVIDVFIVAGTAGTVTTTPVGDGDGR